eukprot:133892_1
MPRLFICDINQRNYNGVQYYDGSLYVPKQYEKRNQQTHDYWKEDEPHPDHKLALIFATSKTFQTKIHNVDESPFINSFVRKTNNSLQKKNKSKYIYEICDEIQNELEHRFIKFVFNNNCRFIKFVVNQNKQQYAIHHLKSDIDKNKIVSPIWGKFNAELLTVHKLRTMDDDHEYDDALFGDDDEQNDIKIELEVDDIKSDKDKKKK